MERRIQITVEDVIQGDADDAFDQMIRFDTYNEWWSKSLPTKCVQFNNNFVGNKLLISPYPFIKVGWEIHSFIPSREIIIHYYHGMHEGVGIWSFSDLDDGKVSVSFEIDILPKRKLYEWAYKIFNVEKIHTIQVKEVIFALEQKIKEVNSNHASKNAGNRIKDGEIRRDQSYS